MTAVEAGRPYLSIGEVLNVLKDEFPDVTVSKIRFLETEDLIHPERTPTGYRKFSSTDIDRLRFILRQQRDHFLPLKVIRERIEQWEASSEAGSRPTSLFAAAPEEDVAGSEHEPVPDKPAGATPPPDVLSPLVTGVSMSAADLQRAAGIAEDEMAELTRYGLLNPQPTADGEHRYDEIDLEVAKLCRELLALGGIEPRHLRVFRSTADRWVALADQMVMPLVKQRNPDARRQATSTVRDLVRIGDRLLHAMLRDGLRSYHG